MVDDISLNPNCKLSVIKLSHCSFKIIVSNIFPIKLLSVNTNSDRPISQTLFMLSIAINRAEHVCATVIIKHNYMLMCNHKIVINIMLCLLNSTGHI